MNVTQQRLGWQCKPVVTVVFDCTHFPTLGDEHNPWRNAHLSNDSASHATSLSTSSTRKKVTYADAVQQSCDATIASTSASTSASTQYADLVARLQTQEATLTELRNTISHTTTLLNNHTTALAQKIDNVESRANHRLSTLENNLQQNTVNVNRICNDMQLFLTRFQQMTSHNDASPPTTTPTTADTTSSPDTKRSKNSSATSMDSSPPRGNTAHDAKVSFMSTEDAVTGLPASGTRPHSQRGIPSFW